MKTLLTQSCIMVLHVLVVQTLTLFTVFDNDVEGTTVSATGGVVVVFAESVLLCHVEPAKRSILAWLPSPSGCNSR